jgi:nucleoside 2-deoxyribosyltransferase
MQAVRYNQIACALTGMLFVLGSPVARSEPGPQTAQAMTKETDQKRSCTDPSFGSTLKIYVASPLGFTGSTRQFMDEKLIPTIRKTGIIPCNPWDENPEITALIDHAKSITDLNARRSAWQEVVKALGAANANLISMANGIVAVLDGVDVDSGTAAEIGYGAALGKWIVGYREDRRRTGEDQAAEVNLQVEYFVTKNGGVIVHSLSELEGALNRIAKR